jgi:hypothetical protein
MDELRRPADVVGIGDGDDHRKDIQIERFHG